MPSMTARRYAAAVFLVACILRGQAAAAPREWTDATGKFRIQAELVAVRNDKVILEKTDGNVITIPLDKLSAADVDYLKSRNLMAPGAGTREDAAGSATALAGEAQRSAAMSERVHSILQANCYRCHGQDGTSEGGFNFVLDLEKLTRTFVRPKNSAGSRILERMSAKDETVMPPQQENLRPSAADLAFIKSWIDAGAPFTPAVKPREFITNQAILKQIAADTTTIPERSRRFLRYFTLTHLYNAGLSEDELQTYRNAFAKLINGLSWNSTLLIPEAIDNARTIFRVDIRQLQWSGSTWEAIEAANPYFMPSTTQDALACHDATQARMPFVRIDWFVFAASRPPLYHTILAIPSTDKALEELLHVNVEANIEQEQVVRAAFSRSGVSQHNRLIERHKSPHGSYWKSYDFGGSVGRQNLFEHPLGPGRAAESFRQDGGEIIFTLPNGLQGYMLVDGNGARLERGLTQIVSDAKQPDRAVVNGISCMACHHAGVIAKTDEVRAAVSANPSAYKNADDILALYREPAVLNALFDEDRHRFAGALRKIGVTSYTQSGEPIVTTAARFQQELDLQFAACEFGITAEDMRRRIDSAPSIRRTYSPLCVAGGTIKRDALAATFIEAATEFGLVSRDRNSLRAARPQLGNAPASAASAAAPLSVSANDKPGEAFRFNDMGLGAPSLAFSPNGKVLAVGKSDKAVWLYDLTSRARLQTIDKLDALRSVQSCAFSPNGTELITAGRSGLVQVYRPSRDGSWKESGQFAGHTQEVNCLAISGDGRFVLSGGKEKKLRYWDIASGQEEATLVEFERPIQACFLATSGLFALATDGAMLLEIDLQKREVSKRLPLPIVASGRNSTFSADGNYLAWSDAAKIRLWELTEWRELPSLEVNENAASLAFTPDGSRLVCGQKGSVSVWDFRRQTRIYSFPTRQVGLVESLAISPDGRLVAAVPNAFRPDLQIFRIPP